MLNLRTTRGLMAALLCCTGTAVTALAQPANNVCGDNTASFTIPGTGGSGSQTTTDTAGWTRDGAACTGTTGADVYWYFTPTSAGPWQIDLCTAGSFDSVLSVHNNVCPVSATTYADGLAAGVACDDDTPGCGSGSSSIVTVTLTAGNTYIIRVGRFSGTAAAAYTLSVTDLNVVGACCAPDGSCSEITAGACTSPSVFQGAGTTCTPNNCPQPPANDLCANATVIPATPLPVNVSATGSLATAGPTTTITPGVCASSARDTFYSFTPIDSGNYTITTCNSVTGILDTVVSVHTGCPADGNNDIACNDDSCTGGAGPSTISNFALTGGTTYIIRVARWSTGAGGPYRLDISTGAFGACCDFVNGTCLLQSQSSCTGAFQGDGVACTTTLCTGACCNPTTGACTLTGSGTCPSGSTYQGNGTTCTPTNPCPQPPPPANDVCTGATLVNVGAPAASGSNQTATTGTDEIHSCQTSSARGVWFDFTAPAAGSYLFDTEGSAQFDTVLSVFTACGGAELGCDDDSGTGNLSSVVVGLAANQNVRILLSSFGTTAAGGGYVLNISSVIAGACCNDLTGACTSVVVPNLCPTGSTYQGDNTVCNPSPCPPSGSCCDPATGACLVRIQMQCASPSVWTLGQTCTPTNPCPQPPPPANDECTSAVALSVGVAGSGTITNATGTDISTCSGSTDDVWFSVSPTIAGTYQVTTTPNSGTDDATAIAVYTACPPAIDSDIACSAQPFPGSVNNASFTADGTTTYFVRAAGFDGDIGSFSIIVNPVVSGACCNFTTGACTIVTTGVCPTGATYLGDNTVCDTTTCPLPPPPANDTCATAQALTLNVPFTGNNAAATSTGDGPAATCQALSSKGVWFTFLAPANGDYGVTTCGSTQDTVLQVYTITNCADDLTYSPIACDDDTCDGITPPGSGLAAIIAPTTLTGGTTYYIRLTTFGSAPVGGDYTITVTGTAPATGRCCIGGRCAIVAPAACVPSGLAGASFTAGAADCNAAAVFNTPCCYADYNKLGGVTVQDIFDYLADYFNSSVNANIGGDGVATPTVQDIFDYLAAYFAGGC